MDGARRKKRSAEKNGGLISALLCGNYTQKSAIAQYYFYAEKNHRFFRQCGVKRMNKLRIMFLLVGCISFMHIPTSYANVASKAYVDDLSGAKESLSNKTNTLTAESTAEQYPSAKTVYDGLSYRVDTRDDAEQTLGGKYTVSGEFSVPDQPLPTIEE